MACVACLHIICRICVVRQVPDEDWGFPLGFLQEVVMTKSFAQQLSDARLMIAGVGKNLDALGKIGLTAADVEEMESTLKVTSDLDSRQESLKAELRTCTAELNKSQRALAGLVSAAKKRVKLVMPQELWREFGIGDKR